MGGQCLQIVSPPGCGHLGGLSLAGGGGSGVQLLLVDAAVEKLHVLASHAELQPRGGAREAEALVAEEAAALEAAAAETAAEEAALEALLDDEWRALQRGGGKREVVTAVPEWPRLNPRAIGYCTEVSTGVYREPRLAASRLLTL